MLWENRGSGCHNPAQAGVGSEWGKSSGGRGMEVTSVGVCLICEFRQRE